MRWTFWRRRRSEDEPDTPSPEAAAPRELTPADETEDKRRPTPAFSGASPEPGVDAQALLAGGAVDLKELLRIASDDPSLDHPGVRADVVAMVEAALSRDPAVIAAVLRRLDARGPDEPRMASIAAMAALGDRCAAAADVPSGTADRNDAMRAEVVAQGDTVAGRAEPLLRLVAPDASRDLVRSVVRLACGAQAQDPDLAHLVPSGDRTRITAALLAQTARDGGGDTRALARELADLLPG